MQEELFSDGFILSVATGLCRRGIVVSGEITPVATLKDTWELVLQDEKGNKFSVLKKEDKEKKQYKSLRGAAVDAEKIGLKRVEIIF
jgi:hypothetical protein